MKQNGTGDLFAWAFDPARGEIAKQDAMAQVEDAAAADWWAFMLAAVREVAERQEFFTSDDVERLRLERGGPATHEKRAYGPLIMHARRAGICAIAEPERFERSALVHAHRRPNRVWRSLIFAGGGTM